MYDHPTRGPSRSRRARLLPVAAVLITLASLAPALAAPPARQACTQTDSGERIKCKFANIIDQQRGVADMLGQMGVLPAAEQLSLSDQIDRAGKAQGRTGPMDFKQLTKKSSVECQVQEILGDGKGDDDGVCTAGEDCAEVIGDQIGNDDGVCKPMNGKNREACVEICDADAVNGNPANFDDDPAVDSRGRDLEESLDDLTDRYQEANDILQQEALRRQAIPESVQAQGPGSACDTILAQRPSNSLRLKLDAVADGARVGADIADKFCNQDAAGFNAAIPCAVGEAIAGGARIIADAFKFEDDSIESDTIDTTYACLQETAAATNGAAGAVAGVGDDVRVVSGQVSGVDQKVVVLDQKVNDLTLQLARVQEMLAIVTKLLNTPQGQRPDFTGSSPK